MIFKLILLCSLLLLVTADYLLHPFTIQVGKGQKECFHEHFNTYGINVTVMYEVAEGSTFHIGVQVTDPLDKVLYSKKKSEEGQFDFTSELPGEYSFCFFNDKKGVKEINFNVAIERPKDDSVTGHMEESRRRGLQQEVANLQHQRHETPEDLLKINDKCIDIMSALVDFTKFVDHMSLETHRTLWTGENLLKTQLFYSFMKMWLIVLCSGVQVILVKKLFQNAKDLNSPNKSNIKI